MVHFIYCCRFLSSEWITIYPFRCGWWTLELLPFRSCCKYCCSEHLCARLSGGHVPVLLGVHLEVEFHGHVEWVSSTLADDAKLFAKLVFQFTFPLVGYEGPCFSTSSLPALGMVSLSHSQGAHVTCTSPVPTPAESSHGLSHNSCCGVAPVSFLPQPKQRPA